MVVLLLAALVRNLVRIRRLRQASRLTPLRDYTLAEHPRVQSPFSFWRTIFLLREERPDANLRAMIVAHEAAHIRHGHSRDKVALGVLKALCWFNPFFWMMERMLSEVQEYEADEDVLRAIGQLKIMYTAPKGPAVERRMPPPVGVNGTVTLDGSAARRRPQQHSSGAD